MFAAPHTRPTTQGLNPCPTDRPCAGADFSSAAEDLARSDPSAVPMSLRQLPEETATCLTDLAKTLVVRISSRISAAHHHVYNILPVSVGVFSSG